MKSTTNTTDVLKQHQQMRFTKTSMTMTTTMSSKTVTTTSGSQLSSSVQTMSAMTKTTTATGTVGRDELMTVREDDVEDVDKSLSVNANNSCVMLEESAVSQNDIDIDTELDEDDAGDDEDDDDDGIMYSDVESDDDGHVVVKPDQDEVVNIDANDADDPQLCSAYVREIYSYLTYMERKYRISANFLDRKVTPPQKKKPT